MKTQIKRISVLQSSKVAAIFAPVTGIFHAGGGAVMIVIGFVMDMPTEDQLGLLIPGFILLFMPVFLIFIGFIFTALFSLFYNWIASLVGGFEFELEEQKSAPHSLDDAGPDRFIGAP